MQEPLQPAIAPAPSAPRARGAAAPVAVAAEVALPRSLLALCGSLIAVGFIARALPLLDFGGRLLQQFPTEDGYLMLTIARNVALGHGMSTAAGTIPTNGTQPLFNLIEAVGFWVVGGDRQSGVGLALGLQIVFSLLSAYLLGRIALRLLADRPRLAERCAVLAPAVWFASPIIVPHSMNCLETGLYTLLILLSVYTWHGLWLRRNPERPALRAALLIGGLLGLTFWARIDAVFLIFAMTVTHAAMALRDGVKTIRARLAESYVMGAVSVVVASPWLVYNRVNFGSVMPISGQSQARDIPFGHNLGEVPSKLFEYANLIVPIPQVLERSSFFLAVASVVAVAYVGLLAVTYRRLSADQRALFSVVAGMSVPVIGYYGLLFGAPHFVGRYFFPFSPFTALFSATLVVVAYDRWLAPRRFGRPLAMAAGAAALLVVIGLQARFYRKGDDHMHFQVVAWVARNVPENTWVAAVQTGTLGFFHDRTINLDGKVNPEAMRARNADKVLDYVVSHEFGPERARIEYLTDWAGIADWINREPVASHFELLVNDPRLNLAVLRRRNAVSVQH